MILSLWFWGRKIAGRRSLVSVSGVFPLLFLMLLVLMSIIFSIVRVAR